MQPRLLRYATVLVGRDAAEDVTAEAWLQISRDLTSSPADGDRFRGWAATIVHHRAMDVCRAGARRPTTALPDDERDEPVGASDTAVVALDALSTDLALTLIATLPREQAQAVLLRAVVGLDARTAGEVLGKRPGAVRVAAHRGLKSSLDSFATTPRKAGGPLSDPRHRRGSNGNRRPGAARHEMHNRRFGRLTGATAQRLLDGGDGPPPLPQLVAAVTAPATAAELRGEAAARAAFRSSTHAAPLSPDIPRRAPVRVTSSVIIAKVIAAITLTAGTAGGIALAATSTPADPQPAPPARRRPAATRRPPS